MRKTKQQGAVSLFVVIFSALLITTITVAFVRLMTQNQMQASLNDLSKSALDSAYAGIEDAKRALVTYRRDCVGTGPAVSSQECQDLIRVLQGSERCDTLQEAGIVGSSDDDEVLIKQTEGDEALQQAYTCVKIKLNTEDYIGSIAQNTSRLIPLRSDGSFNKVKIQWYSQDDLRATIDENNDDEGPTFVDLGTDAKLPKLADWPANRPAMLRVQLVQFADTFNLSDFNQTDSDGSMNNATLFLVPSSVGLEEVNFSYDLRQSQASGALQQIRCKTDFSSTSTYDYACEATLVLPNPIGGNSDNRRAYMRVSQIYNPSTTYKVSLWSDTDIRRFSAVQPEVDSTGRANDLFRRIKARVEMESSNIPPLESAIDISGGLCKTFLVTDRPEEFNPGSCS